MSGWRELAGQGSGVLARLVLPTWVGSIPASGIPYLRESGCEEVITFRADLGQGDELEPIVFKASSRRQPIVVGDSD